VRNVRKAPHTHSKKRRSTLDPSSASNFGRRFSSLGVNIDWMPITPKTGSLFHAETQPKQPSWCWTKLKGPAGQPICSLAEVVYLERAKKLAHKTVIERFVAVVRSKKASPTWSHVRVALLHFDRAGLLGLVQDLYTASKDNQAFLQARLGLGHDQLQPFRASISNWICPDVTKNRPISVSKAKKAIADYKKAIGRPDGMAELSIFYCEEAFGFLESCSMEDESYFAALIRMYERSLEFVLSLPPAERANYVERLDKLRSRGRHVGWGVHDELNSLWYAAALDEHQ
jgi:hypothetical protein